MNTARISGGDAHLSDLGVPLLLRSQPVHSRPSKRVFDVVGALVALVLLAPVFLVVALAVFISDPGPILFRQVRVGADGRLFRMVKFRSMRTDAEEILRADPDLHRRYLANSCKLDADEDPRLIRMGRWLRRSSLDELPQFLNVLKGDMSLVGPRPVLPQELVDHYGTARSHYLATRPGLTGAWQVSGRSSIDYADRVELDRAYVDGWSFRSDVSILARTPVAVLLCRGAY